MAEAIVPPVTPPGEGTPPPATPPATPPGEGVPPPSWFSGFPEDVKGYVELKGFKDPESVVKSYRDMEKFVGVPKDRLLRLPENLDDDKALGEIFSKLGRPEKPEGYSLELPEGMDPEFSKWAQGQFHELGLTKKQGEALTKKWNERAINAFNKEKEDVKTAAVQQVESMKQKWGAAYEQNSKLVEQFQEKLGLDDKFVNKLDQALGIDGTNEFLLSVMTKFGIGQAQMGDPEFRSGDNGGGNTFGILSPAAANARIEELKSDKEWIAKFSAGGAAEKAEWDRIHRWSLGMK